MLLLELALRSFVCTRRPTWASVDPGSSHEARGLPLHVGVNDDPELGENTHRADDLTELYSETRILLPGTQVFLGFLVTIPFTSQFAQLSPELRLVYLTTFFSALLAATLFIAPAAYHRFARPIQHKHAFKLLANALVLAGLLPLTASVVLVTYLITSVVAPPAARIASAAIGVLLLALWWVLPVLRVHETYLGRPRHRERRS